MLIYDLSATFRDEFSAAGSSEIPVTKGKAIPLQNLDRPLRAQEAEAP
jgi:hypothetical protein